MCVDRLSTASSRLVPCSCTLAGKATQALERSLKRQRTAAPTENLATAALQASFNLDQMFNSIHEESFPSISFPSEDTETRQLGSSSSFGLSRKRDHSGSSVSLSRSKSIKEGLASLSEANNLCSDTVIAAPAKVSCEKIAITSSIKELSRFKGSSQHLVVPNLRRSHNLCDKNNLRLNDDVCVLAVL